MNLLPIIVNLFRQIKLRELPGDKLLHIQGELEKLIDVVSEEFRRRSNVQS